MRGVYGKVWVYKDAWVNQVLGVVIGAIWGVGGAVAGLFLDVMPVRMIDVMHPLPPPMNQGVTG